MGVIRTPLDAVVDIATHVDKQIARIGQAFYRKELVRRLRLRGWAISTNTHLLPGETGDSQYRAKMDILAWPPPCHHASNHQPPSPGPILIEIERNTISWWTRAKLQAWGHRPHQGKLVIVLYRGFVESIPEAQTIALGHVSNLTISRHEGKRTPSNKPPFPWQT